MNVTFRMVRFAAAGLLLALGACGGGGDEGGGTPPPPPPPQTGIGPTGGTVLGPSGAKVEIPPVALATNVEIKVELTPPGAPALPSGFSAFGQMFAFTPHGTTFAVPVTITLPFDPTSVPAGTTPELYKTNAQNQWEQVANATFGAASVSAQLTSFSDVTVVIPPLVRNDPERIWKFQVFPGNGDAEVTLPCGINNCRLVGGRVDEIATFGPADFDSTIIRSSESLPADGFADGFIFSTANGVTYGVLAEAPINTLGSVEPIGSLAHLTQLQSFTKRAADASLTFTVSRVEVLTTDFNPGDQTSDALLTGEVLLDVAAYKTPNAYFFHAAGRASVIGDNGFWIPRASDESNSSNHLWSLAEDFDFATTNITYTVGDPPFTCGPGTQAYLKLKKRLTYSVDLSSIGVNEEFTLRAITFAKTNDRRGGVAKEDCLASSVTAYLQDPLEIGGTTLTFTGLEPTNRPLPPPPDHVLVAPASCVPGPGPIAAAGVLQFDAANYSVSEAAGALQTITITRTGGSSGAVTATFTTSDGTAVGGTDYTALNATVFFADGDAGQRLVEVPILPDLIDEPDRTVNLTLSQPGGCAALGAQTTALLTIRDDDASPPGAGLDASFGSGGKATSTAFGGARSAMALQADGKIVMVGGTFTDFILARFKADGSLDESFGFDSGGKITTNMVAGEQQEALGVAIQPDGKIVVVGHAGQAVGPTVFALARYKEDGSLDETFGADGKVISTVPGRAFAVAIQIEGPDIKIVVAGDDLDAEDFALARFDANGSLDASFGNGGRINANFDPGSELAGNIVLQPNGAILISGPHTNAGEVTRNQHTVLARYDADGNPDDSFGIDGKLTLSGQRVGEGLALQSDGKIVLVGNAGDGVDTSFAAARLEADGSPDNTFGDAGTVSTSISGLGDAALAVAIQGDDKIVVAGRSSTQTNSNFAVARYDTDGVLDTGFVNTGTLIIDFFGFTDIAESVAVQPDGNIVLGGLARDNVSGYGVARVVP